MAANSKPFYIINRKVKKNKLLYVRFLNRDGNLGAPLSVTALAHKIGYPKTEKITKKREAERVCAIALERGLVKTINLKQTFIEFVKDYWDYNGKRVQRKIRLKPNSIGKAHCYTMATLFTLHAVPYLQENADISDITRRDLQHVLNKLVDDTKLTNSSIHKVMMSMTVPLHYAYKNDLILTDPTKNLDPIDQRGKEKGILTPSEFKAVSSWMEVNSPPHV
jgi:hypothetical protein